ncbi:F0F1 ATP synthase subunit delta [Tessaracoccus sp. Z1128]
MRARDAAPAGLDGAVDSIVTDATTASELFAVVDLIDGQPMLRRSLSDPSASVEDRLGLAARLFRGRVSEATLTVITEAVKASWKTGADMVAGLERQGIRLSLQHAHRAGVIDEVADQLHSLTSAIDGNRELAATLRNQTYPVAAKQELVDTLIAGKVAPATRTLAARAVRARRRNIAQTVDTILEMAAEVSGEKIARVTVARPLDEARIARLKAALEAQIGRTVSLQIDVDPSVLGGMNVAIDDDVIESTVAARLDHARRQLSTL